MHYFLNIGSNLGNRILNISRAVRALEAEFGYFEISKKMESKPWGFDSINMFVNVCVMVISDITPEEMLSKVKEIERSLHSQSHRTPDGRYADRIIDIDIVAADSLILHSEELTIPHRDLARRPFFLQPMSELAPMWRHPESGFTCDEMLALLPEEDEDKES